MGMKQNAKTAMQELLGHVGIDVDADEKGISEEAQSDASVLGTSDGQEILVVDDAKAVRPATGLIPTVIGADTRIDGSIVSQAPLEIYGSVNGNVTTTDRVYVKGGIIGDVHGNSVALSGCRVRGNLASGTSVTIDKDSILVGDLTADSIEIDGKVKGNVTAVGSVEMKDHGMIVGDVVAGHFAMAIGSRIVGNIHLNQKNDENVDINTVFAF